MEGTLGEIRLFAGSFAPSGWKFCNGAELPIDQYNAVFAILGTTYGGDGVSTFKLPDFQSRVVIGTGQGAGLPNYVIGQTLGEEEHTLTAIEMPVHTHQAVVQTNQGTSSLQVSLMGINGQGGATSPQGGYLGNDTGGGYASYAPGTSTPLSAMASGSVEAANLMAPQPGIGVIPAGGNTPHPNIQPVLGMNYIICLEGIFPSRN